MTHADVWGGGGGGGGGDGCGRGVGGGGFPFIKFQKRNTSFQFYFLPGMTMSRSGKLVRKRGRGIIASPKAVVHTVRTSLQMVLKQSEHHCRWSLNSQNIIADGR